MAVEYSAPAGLAAARLRLVVVAVCRYWPRSRSRSRSRSRWDGRVRARVCVRVRARVQVRVGKRQRHPRNCVVKPMVGNRSSQAASRQRRVLPTSDRIRSGLL
jgi:hypothetical protein